VIVSAHISMFFRVTNSVEKQFFSRFVSPGVIQRKSTVVSRNCCVLCNWLPFIPCTVVSIVKEVTEALLFAQLSISISFRHIQLRYRLVGYVRSMFRCFDCNTLNDKDGIMPKVRFKVYICVCVCAETLGLQIGKTFVLESVFFFY